MFAATQAYANSPGWLGQKHPTLCVTPPTAHKGPHSSQALPEGEGLLAEWRGGFQLLEGAAPPLRTTAITTFRAKEVSGCLATPPGSDGAVWYFLFLLSPHGRKQPSPLSFPLTG